jgi:hypothetical protein
VVEQLEVVRAAEVHAVVDLERKPAAPSAS